jgi:hypothetical protein
MQIVHADLEAAAHQIDGQVLAEIAESDEAVAQVHSSRI